MEDNREGKGRPIPPPVDIISTWSDRHQYPDRLSSPISLWGTHGGTEGGVDAAVACGNVTRAVLAAVEAMLLGRDLAGTADRTAAQRRQTLVNEVWRLAEGAQCRAAAPRR